MAVEFSSAKTIIIISNCVGLLMEENKAEKESVTSLSEFCSTGTCLVVADGSEEFKIALAYAGQMARANNSHVGILHVIEKNDFMHWGNIETRMRIERRKQAEDILNEACLTLEKTGCGMPSLYIEEDGRMDALVRVIEQDRGIKMLVLAGETQGGGPGPLVSYFTGKGFPKLRVPVMIVPDNYAFETLDM